MGSSPSLGATSPAVSGSDKGFPGDGFAPDCAYLVLHSPLDDDFLEQATEIGLLPPGEALRRAGETGDAMAPHAFGEGLQQGKDEGGNPFQGMPGIGLMVVDEHSLAARRKTRQQGIDDGAFIAVRHFVQEEEADDHVVRTATGARRVGKPRRGLGNIPHLAFTGLDLRRRHVDYLQPPLGAEQMRQLGVEPESILLEPMGRNTAPAVCVAALRATARGEDPLLLVLAADHVIREPEKFRATVEAGIPAAEAGRLVTFGIVPTAPETGYGYIESAEALNAASGYLQRELKTSLSLKGTPHLRFMADDSIEKGAYLLQRIREVRSHDVPKENDS